MITRDFLKKKAKDFDCGWSNIDRLSSSVLAFTTYNELPRKDYPLCGHYCIYVNYITFKYLVYKVCGLR